MIAAEFLKRNRLSVFSRFFPAVEQIVQLGIVIHESLEFEFGNLSLANS